MGSALVGGILIVVAVPLGLTWGLASAIGNPTVPRSRWMKWVWWSAPIAFAFGFGISATDLALTARVWLCESELRAFAEAVPREAAPGRRVAPQRVGLFHVRGAGARGAKAGTPPALAGAARWKTTTLPVTSSSS